VGRAVVREELLLVMARGSRSIAERQASGALTAVTFRVGCA
jgi:hypothetical protein